MKLTIHNVKKMVNRPISSDWFCAEVFESKDYYDFKICSGDRSRHQTLSLYRYSTGENDNIWVIQNDSVVGRGNTTLELDEIKNIRKFINYGLYEALKI